MSLEKLATLKKMIQEATDFDEPWDYFFTHFGENPEFMRSGKAYHDETLKIVIKAVGQQFFKSVDELDKVLLMAVEGSEFIHGGIMLEGKIATVIYFDDADVGLFAIMSMSTMKVTLVRFSKLETQGDVTFVANDKKTLH